MRHLIPFGLLSIAGLLTTSLSASAQVQLSTPKFQVTLGGPVGFAIDSPVISFRAGQPLPPPPGPLVPVGGPIGDPNVPLAPPPRPIGQTPPPVVVPLPAPRPPVQVLSPRPLTHKEFVASFQPLPGRYDVMLLHSRRGCPVRVCFELPPGCPKVHCHKHGFEFDYGKCEVEVRFALFGRVKVNYDD